MKSLVAAILALSFAVPSWVRAQTNPEDAIRDIPQAFCNAWNRHDGHALAQLPADADFA